MVDFHTHILPGIDDGCKTPQESLTALQTLKRQGITTACLTSHFYASRIYPEAFLNKRQQSYEKLMEAAPNNVLPINVKLGAEVLYFAGISRVGSDLLQLCYEGTNILLLEMPFHEWSHQMVDEILALQSGGDVRIIMAHVERYWDCVSDDVFRVLFNKGVKFQMNCECLLNWKTKRKGLRAIKNWNIHYLGSDTHNLKDRAPHFDTALALLERKHLFGQIDMFKGNKI